MASQWIACLLQAAGIWLAMGLYYFSVGFASGFTGSVVLSPHQWPTFPGSDRNRIASTLND
jgi:hypothetical protein